MLTVRFSIALIMSQVPFFALFLILICHDFINVNEYDDKMFFQELSNFTYIQSNLGFHYFQPLLVWKLKQTNQLSFCVTCFYAVRGV
jgi:hypothetical protein